MTNKSNATQLQLALDRIRQAAESLMDLGGPMHGSFRDCPPAIANARPNQANGLLPRNRLSLGLPRRTPPPYGDTLQHGQTTSFHLPSLNLGERAGNGKVHQIPAEGRIGQVPYRRRSHNLLIAVARVPVRPKSPRCPRFRSRRAYRVGTIPRPARPGD